MQEALEIFGVVSVESWRKIAATPNAGLFVPPFCSISFLDVVDWENVLFVDTHRVAYGASRDGRGQANLEPFTAGELGRT
jgi:hypothetical protein